MKRCPRSLPFLKGLVLYSAIPRRTPTAHRPHTQYRAKYRAESPGAGSSVAHRNTAVTKRARDVDATNSALFARLRRSQASQPAKILVAPLDLAPIKDMVAGAVARARKSYFAQRPCGRCDPDRARSRIPLSRGNNRGNRKEGGDDGERRAQGACGLGGGPMGGNE